MQDLRIIDPAIQFRCGNGKGWFAYNDGTVRKGRKVGKHFSATRCQLGSACNAEGNIGADRCAKILQGLAIQRVTEHLIQSPENGGRIGRSSSHSRAYGDVFLYIDGDPGPDPRMFKKGRSSLDPQVAAVIGNITKVASGTDPVRFREPLQRNIVIEGSRLHHHDQLMIPVRPHTGDIQRQIQFCVCLCVQSSHHSELAFKNDHGTAVSIRRCRLR